MTFKLIAVPQNYNFTSCFMCVKIGILLFGNEVLRSVFEPSEYRLEGVHVDGGFFSEQKFDRHLLLFYARYMPHQSHSS
jgi:hypothetical protein